MSERERLRREIEEKIHEGLKKDLLDNRDVDATREKIVTFLKGILDEQSKKILPPQPRVFNARMEGNTFRVTMELPVEVIARLIASRYGDGWEHEKVTAWMVESGLEEHMGSTFVEMYLETEHGGEKRWVQAPDSVLVYLTIDDPK